jgi:WD40 repeat protein
LDESHLGCSKEILYIADRLCVLRDSHHKQRIYDFHRRKVTCIAIHPDRQLIISCEESAKTPILHLWDADQMVTKAVIPTRHQFTISKVAFSRDGEWVVTLGGF